MGTLKYHLNPNICHIIYPLGRKEELENINEDKGITVCCGDVIERNIRVHVLWITADRAKRVKLAANCGHNGRCPCETCNIEGHWSPHSKQYYDPSKISHTVSESGQSRDSWSVKFKIDQLPKHTRESIENIWVKLDLRNTSLTNTERRNIPVRTSIKPKTAIYSIVTIKPLISFPHDCRHHIMT